MRNCVICTTASNISDKIKAVIFAKKIAEAEAEAKRKRNITIAIVCGAIAVVAAVAAVVTVIILKKKEVELNFKTLKEKVASKFSKKDECECVCEEALEADEIDEACECACEEAVEE
jgi:hypothetical protein